MGKTLVKRLLGEKNNPPSKVIVFSRDEAKQHELRLSLNNLQNATDETIYNNFLNKLEFRIGDVRDYGDVVSAVSCADIVINAAALKQVPTAEYFPSQAVRTNCIGAENIVRAIHEHQLPVEVVVGISTDKAAKPVNVMGMTKAIQERIFISANILSPKTRFVCVRYGNVLASRGSVIPLFLSLLRSNLPLKVTVPEMTRFLLSLEQAVDTVVEAISNARTGEIVIPNIASATILDLAQVMAEKYKSKHAIQITGIRPGEKMHEVLIAEEEARYTEKRGQYYFIASMLPEIGKIPDRPGMETEFSSAHHTMNKREIENLLNLNGLLSIDFENDSLEEILR